MKEDKIKKAFSELTPSEELSERIMDMAASYEKSAVITEQPIRTARPGRVLKLAAIAAALVILMAVSVYGIVNRLFYLPGAGLVDEDGVLVIREDDIGDLDITAYKTPEEYELGGFVIESVTYTEYNGLASFTIWSHMGDELMASCKKDSYGNPRVTVADHVIEDLKIILPDGSSLAPESVRSSSSGSIVYNFAAEKLNTKLTLVSESLGAELKVELGLVEDVGYSYMEYPTDSGITMIISPEKEDFSQFKIDVIDNTISDGFAEYIQWSEFDIDSQTMVFLDSNGEDAIKNRNGLWLSISDPDRNNSIHLTLHNKLENGYDIKQISLERVALIYSLESYQKRPEYFLMKMPADGERIDQEIVLFDHAGFTVKVLGCSREGNSLTLYVDGAETDLISLRGRYFQVPYSGTNGCASAHAMLHFSPTTLSPDITAEEPIILAGRSGMVWEIGDDGICYHTIEFDGMPNDTLDSYEEIRINLSSIACIFEGNWTVNY